MRGCEGCQFEGNRGDVVGMGRGIEFLVKVWKGNGRGSIE